MRTASIRSISALALIFLMLPIGCGTSDVGPNALSDVDPNALIVLLREDCQDPAELPGVGLDDCFESMHALSNVSTGWIWTVRDNSETPLSEDEPLLVDIGPGKFGRFSCPDVGPERTGFVSLRGSGRQQTMITEPFDSAVLVKNCTHLGFSNLTIEGRAYGVIWEQGGNAVWDNVDIVSRDPTTLFNVAWTSTACGAEPSRHEFSGSRIRATGIAPIFNFAINNSCAEMRFYGGEIFLDFTDQTSSVADTLGALAITVHGSGDVQVYGTAVRTRSIDGPTQPQAFGAPGDKDNLIGVGVSGSDASFTMHAGIINTTATGIGVDSVGLFVRNSGKASVVNTAFVLNSEDELMRVYNSGGGSVQAPFLWPPGPTPPPITSQNGSDLYVETDCQSTGTGTCTGGDEPHLMVYNDAECPTEQWFDIVTGCCRNDLNCTGP